MIELSTECFIRNKDISLLLNGKKITVISPSGVSLNEFLSWFSQVWFQLHDEGFLEAVFDKKNLIQFLKDMTGCPWAMRSYKKLNASGFLTSCSTPSVAMNDRVYECEVCIKIKEVGNLYFDGSYLYFHDLENNELHIGYVD